MFNEIRRALSGKSPVSVQVLLKVNYYLKYSYACVNCAFAACVISHYCFILLLSIHSLEMNANKKRNI